MRNGYRGAKIRLPATSYEERCAARWPDRYPKVESTEDFKLRIREVITGNKPFHVGRQIDHMTDEEREVLKLKGML